MITIDTFEEELRQIDKSFEIKKNSRAVGMATVFLKGEPMFSIGAGGLPEVPMPMYGMELPSGSFVRHRTYEEAMAMAKNVYRMMKDDHDSFDALTGKGEYSDENLRA